MPLGGRALLFASGQACYSPAMAKTKRQTRRQRDRGQSSPEKGKRAAPEEAGRPPIPPRPPRKNLPLLLLCTVLLFGFLVYLAVVAWTAAQS